MQIVDETENLRAGSRIQIAGGFVSEQDRRKHAESARDGNALSFAAGKLIRQMFQTAFELNQVK